LTARPVSVQVLGPGCPKCDLVAKRVRAVLDETGLAGHVEKVTDIETMLAQGIVATPALVIDGRVRSSGRIPRPEEIEAWLRESAG
jgi:small redox-active disulfide protein 2